MLLSKLFSKIEEDIDGILPLFLFFISLVIVLVSFYLFFSWYILIATFLLSEFLFLFEKKINNPSLGRVALKKSENIYEAAFYLSIINLIINLIIFVIRKTTLEQAINYFVYFIVGIFGTIDLIIVIWIWLKLNKKIIKTKIKKQLKGGK